jgi:hypothetical protein
MKTHTTLLGVLSGAGAAVVLRPVNTYQGFMLKSTVTANTPALALLGALTAALGVKQRSCFALVGGAVGAGTAAASIRRVTAPHGGFARAFGPDWHQRIPPAAERRMLQRRLTWHLPTVPEPRDVPFCTILGTDRQLLADLWEPPAGVAQTGTAIV